jgi:hypothetical protein
LARRPDLPNRERAQDAEDQPESPDDEKAVEVLPPNAGVDGLCAHRCIAPAEDGAGPILAAPPETSDEGDRRLPARPERNSR